MSSLLGLAYWTQKPRDSNERSRVSSGCRDSDRDIFTIAVIAGTIAANVVNIDVHLTEAKSFNGVHLRVYSSKIDALITIVRLG